MSLNETSRKDIVAYRIERAYVALEQAKGNLEMNYLEVTANRLYYAAHYAVSALLIAYHIPAHTHEGNIMQFGLHFVKQGTVSREMGKFYSQLFEMRMKGDYSDRFGLKKEDVVAKVQPTEEFINCITELARSKMTDESNV